MQMTVIVDASGKVIAAHRPAPGVAPRSAIRPARDDHTMHRLDLPQDMEIAPLHEVVRRFRIGDDGKPGWTDG
jgi:hypothetical protein